MQTLGTLQTNRRDFTKLTGAAVAAATVGVGINTSIERVAATDSGEIEMTTVATFNEEESSAVVTVTEYEDGIAINSQSVEIDNGENTYILDELEGEVGGADEYNFEVEMGTDSDEVELDSLVLAIPDSLRLAFRNHTGDGWKIDIQERNIEILFDQFTLRKYQPKLVMDPETRKRFKGLYSYVARSDDENTYVCCYWMQKTHQDGLPLVSADSHLGDHEPIYVFVDEETDEVDRIVYTGYHWYASEVAPDEIKMVSDRHSSETHATFEVIDPWHHYRRVPEDGSSGALFAMDSWPAERSSWIDNGFYDPAEPEAIEDPWTMLDRDGWWQDGSMDSNFSNIWRQLGLRGGSQADPLRGGDAGSLTPSFELWLLGGDDE